MKNIAAIALFLASTFIAAGSASAQDRRVMANIPFSFSVGGRILPPGTYFIGSTTNTPGVLNISSWGKQGEYPHDGHAWPGAMTRRGMYSSSTNTVTSTSSAMSAPRGPQ